MNTDLFSTLYHWAQHQEENFTTDAFVYIVNYLLTHEPCLGRRFVEWVCFGDNSFDSFGSSRIIVATQVHDDDGTPDIRIETSDCFILVEVKKASNLHEGQLTQYHTILKRSSKTIRRLVLLTDYRVEYQEEEKPHRYIRWFHVADWMRHHDPSTDSGRFLYAQFLLFLRRQMMTVEQVGWEYFAGIKAFRNLVTMLGKALEIAEVPVSKFQGASEWIGYFLDKGHCWTGVNYSRPNIVRLTIETKDFDGDRFMTLGRGELQNGKPVFELDLNTEAVHFFARTSDSQLAVLTEFLRNAYQDAKSCLVISE